MTLRNHLGRMYRNLFAFLHLAASKRELRQLLEAGPETPAGWIGITEKYRGQGWFADMRAWQVPFEFEAMVRAVQESHPAVIMEIGTAKGATLLSWCRIASEMVISVDLLGGIHGGGYPPIKQELYKELVHGRSGVKLHLFQADSHAPATRAEVEKVLAGKRIDVLFIDGDHTYQGVKADFDLWTPLVRPGGLVLFHDILPHKHVADCEVDRLWNELKPQYDSHEFIADKEQGWAGIGLLRLPAAND